MKRVLFLITAGAVSVGLVLAGCAQKKAASSGEAIKASESLQTVDQKVNYPIDQAKAFYNSREFQKAVDVARYVLRNLDKDSQPAKDLLEKATAQLKATAQKTMSDVKQKLGSIGQ